MFKKIRNWEYGFIYPYYSPKKGYFVAILENITERKEAERKIKDSAEKCRSLGESTEDSIYLIDESLRYLFANEKFLLKFSLPMDKIVGRKYGEFHSKEDTKKFAEKVNKVFETGKSLLYEYQSARDGKYFIRTLCGRGRYSSVENLL